MGQNCPFYLHLYQLHYKRITFCQQFIYVVDKFKSENDIVSDVEMNSHAIEGSLFNGKLSHNLWVMMFKIENDVAIRSVGTH